MRSYIESGDLARSEIYSNTHDGIKLRPMTCFTDGKAYKIEGEIPDDTAFGIMYVVTDNVGRTRRIDSKYFIPHEASLLFENVIWTKNYDSPDYIKFDNVIREFEEKKEPVILEMPDGKYQEFLDWCATKPVPDVRKVHSQTESLNWAGIKIPELEKKEMTLEDKVRKQLNDPLKEIKVLCGLTPKESQDAFEIMKNALSMAKENLNKTLVVIQNIELELELLKRLNVSK